MEKNKLLAKKVTDMHTRWRAAWHMICMACLLL